jgi:hypothetical protein
MVVNIVLTSLTWFTARGRLRRAGERLANPDVLSSQQRAKDTMLTVASLMPAALFWVMVLAGSFHGLVAFGRTTLGWRNGWEYLVPGTLDGVSVTFAMLAFRAVRKQKAPDRCYRVVWGAAIASATINFAHEYETSGNALAGGYVGLLSLFGMVMFDEFLNQFEEGTASVRRENPKFGVRWLTWPTNTLLAAVAWRNHPPAEGTAGTVANAVANLNRVRAAKHVARQARRSRDSGAVSTRASGPAGAERHDGRSTGRDLVLASAAVLPARAPSQSRRADKAGRRRGRDGDDDVRVPATASTVAQWARTWIAMCEHSDLAEAALKDDEVARQHFGCSARQLRHVRYAAMTGALRRRAAELAVALPDAFDESPLATG